MAASMHGAQRGQGGWSGARDPWSEQQVRVPTHVLAGTGYGLIAALGANSDLGVVFRCLLLVSAGAVVVSVLRNLGWGLTACLIGAVPVVGWLVALYVVGTQWERVAEHQRAVTVALWLSTAPYLLAVSLHGAPTVAFLAAAAVWHVGGLCLYSSGYGANTYLKIAALGPAFVFLLVLPMLDLELGDLDFGLEGDRLR